MDVNNLRVVGFENSYLNLGARCRYHMDDSSVAVTREPGWWFSGTVVASVAMSGGPAAMFAGRK